MGPHLHHAGPGYDEVGFALFYGGLVRSKHTLVFGPDKGGIIGSRVWVELGRGFREHHPLDAPGKKGQG